MPILDLQKRSRELGRIRIGQVVPTAKGGTRPAKLDRFRLTSASRELLEKVAALYGGEVKPWSPQGGGADAFEVVTTATRLPILVPPQPITQWYELWSGGGCARRCDGQREVLTEKPCLCDPDPTRRQCKPTTRLNVVLKDVEGLGVWRLESHGYYAAVELPESAEFLARAGAYVSGWLSLEARTAKRNGKTMQWMTPVLEVDITPAALLGGTTAPAAIGAAQPTVAALPAAPAVPQDDDNLIVALAAAKSLADVQELWNRAGAAGMTLTPTLKQAFADRGQHFRQLEEQAALDQLDEDQLWQQILATAPESWDTQAVELHFSETTGVDAGAATADDMRRYLQQRAAGTGA
ncbi:hypothetical protein ACFXGA_05815 [Actinosynnema sp. NPDC059335]|uniref:recombination directionality factor n=1 Tax=Actinosynnema sp. NPDC059335 TaxID=3346804 RepID=UPI0036722C19